MLSGSSLWSSLALAMAPGIPLAPSVKTSSAPKDFKTFRLSILMVSGIVNFSL